MVLVLCGSEPPLGTSIAGPKGREKGVGMLKRGFGPTGFDVPVIGQGTWKMEADDRAGVVAALRRGLDLGMSHIDTAELYGNGEAETRVGEAIAGRRDEVFLVSKVLPQNASRRGTLAACERSLERLGTDRLDGYLLHWPGSHPLEDTLAAFAELEAAGKILSFGVSNFDEDELKQAVAIAEPGKIACNQLLYHLEERTLEHRVLPLCEAEGIAIVAYSPFGSGAFPKPTSPGGRVLDEIASARLPHPPGLAAGSLRHPQGDDARARRRKCRSRRSPTVGRRDPAYRRGVPGGKAAEWGGDAIARDVRSTAPR
jgi:diketogulonate reductase-like aldo/keto reductase